MDLSAALSSAKPQLVDEAFSVIEDLHVHHYQSAGEMFTRAAIDDLFDLVVTAIESRDVAAVVTFAKGVAGQRFAAGFDLAEVQTAFNALETAMWSRVVATQDPAELAESIGLLSTVFGIAKDSLAREYVSLASQRHVRSLDLSAMFRGTTS